jgi:predicted O-methyltransferase YrrM
MLRQRYIKGFIVTVLIPLADVVLSPITLLAALWLKLIRRVGVYRMKVSRALFNRVGVFPIRDHYYEPAFNPRHLREPLSRDRFLPGLDLDADGQLELLARFDYARELDEFPRAPAGPGEFYYDNPNFPPGDSEYLYSMIRLFKPRRILEVGSGFSTLIMLKAIAANVREAPGYRCELRCIEPYEMGWLDALAGVEVIRRRVEDVEMDAVERLEAHDILFIDSSHVIRPQGDVLRLYLEFLPVLKPGVLVHIHDIFTPRDYPEGWVIDEVRLWNEQYLLEAFMACNARFRVIGALNFLENHHPDRLAEKLPVFREKGRCNPGSFWLQCR